MRVNWESEGGNFGLLKNDSHVHYNYLSCIRIFLNKIILIQVRYHIRTPSGHIRHKLTEIDRGTKIITFGKV